MSYSHLILSERPYGYWECSSLVSGDIEDLTGFDNHASINNVETGKKPIIYGPSSSVKLSSDSYITINNSYKIFFSGSEYKSATVELFFNVKDSSTTPHNIFSIGSFLKCYLISDRIFIESGNKKASVRVDDWNSSQYLCVSYNEKSISLILNNLSPTSIYLGEDFVFQDSSPPDIVFGPSAGPELPLYINSIAIYTYEIQFNQVLRRLSWAGYNGKSELLAISKGSEVINPIQLTSMENFSINLCSQDILNKGSIDNLFIDGDRLSMQPIPPAVVSSTEDVLSYTINDSGISFGNNTFIELNNILDKFDTNSSVIRLQYKIDGLATEQSAFYLGPLVDGSYIRMYKTSDNKIAISSTSQFDTSSNIIESTDLGTDYSEYFNLSLTFNNGYIKLFVNEYESLAYSIPDISDGYKIILGNGQDKNSPSTSIIKNFCIDSYNLNDPISYEENGRYMLRFNNSLSVSQRGSWKYSLPILDNSILSSCEFNFGSKNVSVLLNGVRMLAPGIIPEMIYTTSSEILIEVLLETDNSSIDLPFLSYLIIKTYDDCYIPSNNGNYIISPLKSLGSESYVKVNSYEIKNNYVSPLCRPENVGIKFKNSISITEDIDDDLDSETWTYQNILNTSGASLYSNNTNLNQIRVLEFIIKIDDQPVELQEYCIFDIPDLSISLKYNGTDLITTTGYSLYIDSNLYSSPTILESNEIYYMTVVFDASISSDINLGIDSLGNGINASITGIAINESTIDNLENYISRRYNSILGRAYLSHKDSNSINIIDHSSNSQIYQRSEDDKYFAMKELPKVKIVQNKWELVQ